MAVMTNSTDLTNRSTSKPPSARRNFIRLSDARLHDELSRCRYSEHGLDAVIRPVSGRGVPVVDRVVVLQARVGALPRGLRDRAEQLAGVDRLDHRAVEPARQVERAVFLDGAHELVGDAHRVVGVLVLHADDVGAAEVHVEAGVAERPDLVFLAGLGLHELFDVGVVDVEDDHLGRTPGGTAGLDRARRRVGAAHEADRPGRGAAGGEQLLGRADAGQVDPGAGAALEDQTLFLVPVEDRVHRVVDGQDETGTDLLRRRRADVEPHRRVEAEHLVQKHVGQLVLEDLGVGRVAEVAVVLAGLAVGLDDPVDELLERPLPIRGAHGATEVFRGDDVGRVDAPRLRELDAALLEVDRAVTPVRHHHVAALPRHLVVRVDTLGRPHPLDLEPGRPHGPCPTLASGNVARHVFCPLVYERIQKLYLVRVSALTAAAAVPASRAAAAARSVSISRSKSLSDSNER